jgi:hypothetical protein
MIGHKKEDWEDGSVDCDERFVCLLKRCGY